MEDLILFDDAARQRAVERQKLLDTPPEAALDRITSLVRRLVKVPMAAMTLIDNDRSWLKACDGIRGGDFPREHSFCNYVIRRPEPLIVPDTHADPRFRDNPYVTGGPTVAAYAGFPVLTPDGFRVGALCAMDVVPRTFTPEEIAGLGELAELVAEHLAMRRIATEDDLTGALSRRAFVEALHFELARHARYARPAALLMLDVDHFKRVNDTHGHAAGDEVLRALAQCCQGVLRPNDRFGRLGGEEFAILLPETDAGGALAVADRFRLAIADLRIGAQSLQITASFGVAALGAAEDAAVEPWLAAADAALYAAKHAGRNACHLSAA